MVIGAGAHAETSARFFTEDTAMLREEYYRVRLSKFDQEVFCAFVRPDHPLRRAMEVVPWDDFYPLLTPYYCPDKGQPAINPVLMLKLEYLRYRCNLSDSQVIDRSRTDIDFRCFLQIGVSGPLPTPSLLSIFRGRLGREGFAKVFDKVIGTAREHGLVKDRLRIKDASHVIADIAVPSTLALVAQMRDKLLAAAEAFDAVRTEGERVNVELLRERTHGQNNEQRLLARVTHLREILTWVDQLMPPEDTSTNVPWQTLLEQRRLAHKILADQENPQAGDRMLSTVDPDARRGRHGDWYEGYLVDISMDADSELITQINVLPASGDEAADAVELIREEQRVHGNDVQALSIDGAGFNGRVLRELEDTQGLNVNTFVPPPKEKPSQTFTPDDFIEDAEQGCLTCPAGQTSSYRHRNREDRGWIYQFKRSTCEKCELLPHCMSRPPKGASGKTVRKSDYQEEYRCARAKAATAEYAKVRAEHPKVERKLGEMLNRHGGRRARYHGQGKVLIQELMAGMATNVKRLVRLLCAANVAFQHES
jgi:transposase